MYTDVYFTNRTASADDRVGLAFFQWPVHATTQTSCVFKVVDRCPFGWSHLVRIPWKLSFRLIGHSGTISDVYPLQTVYAQAEKKYFLSKDGTLTLLQGYKNGQQQIAFEQVKGKAYVGVRIYRGDFPVAEQYFTNTCICFQVDTAIGMHSFFGGQAGDAVSSALTDGAQRSIRFDYTAMKAIYVQMNAHAAVQLSVEKTEFW